MPPVAALYQFSVPPEQPEAERLATPGPQMVAPVTVGAAGDGFTVIVNVFDVPGHTTLPLVFTGVTVIVAVTGDGPVFTATKEGMIGFATGAEPLPANPIDVLLFVQLKAVALVPVKLTWSVLEPLHTV